jgi:site-specific recombinase XerD
MKGTKRLRGKSWQLRAYAGTKGAGDEIRISQTIRPRQTPDGGTEPVPDREADDELIKLVSRAIRMRDGGAAVSGKKQKQGIVTLKEGFEAWLKSARPNLEPNGADTDEDVLRNYVFPHLGHLELWRFRPNQLAAPGDADYDPDLVSMQAFYALLTEKGTIGRRRVDRRTREVTIVGAGQPLGSEMIRRVHGTCRRGFAYCVERNWIRSNPAVGAKLPPKIKRAASTPAPSALVAFVEFLIEDDPELLCFLDLMNSGARRVDMGLQWTEVSFAAEGGGAVTFGVRGLITARDENGKTQVLVRTTPTRKRKLRTVAIDAGPASRLMALRTHQQARAALCGISLPDTAFVFSGAPDGTAPRHPGWFSVGFRNAKKRAAKAGVGGLNGVRPYDVRHFMITQLLAHGMPAAVVAERAGNSERTMDAFYRHAVPAQDQAAAELMARIMRDASSSC